LTKNQGDNIRGQENTITPDAFQSLALETGPTISLDHEGEMKSMKLEPLLYASNLQVSVKFYCQVLGFDFGEFYPDEQSATFASILIDGHKLRLVQGGKRIPPFHKHGECGSGVQLFVRVPNVDDEYRRVKGSAQVVDEIEGKHWGDREFTIADPDGYLISFYTPTAE